MNNNLLKSEKDSIALNLKCKKIFLPVVLSFAEECSKCFGLKKAEVFSIRLAMEEIFTYLCSSIDDSNVEIICVDNGYFIELYFSFKGNIPLKIFNITATVSPDKETDLAEMGLLIASRFVDKFKIYENDDGSLSLLLIKEKSYPELTGDFQMNISAEKSKEIDIITPDVEQVKLFATRVFNFCNNAILPDFFSYPGKVADMVFSGFYKVLIAVNELGEIIGGIIWHNESHRLIEFFGPYNFESSNENQINEKLIISMIESVGKSDAVGLYSRFAIERLSNEYFEVIGEIPFINATQERISLPVYFRQLKEDSGSIVWCDETIKDFLNNFYKEFFLPRKIEIVHDFGEKMNENSVLSVNFIKSQNTAILHLILSGKDIEENVREHLTLIKDEGFKNIYFETDLGIAEQAYVIPALISNKFIPKLIIPCASTGDTLIFHLENS